MLDGIQLHRISEVKLLPIRHFPAEKGRDEFWTRDLVVKNTNGEFTLGLFSNTADGLVFPVEKGEGMMDKNVSLNSGYTQVCVWPGTFIPEDQTPADFEAFMKKEFDVEAQYLETIVTKPDLDCHGRTVVADTGGRKDLFFALKDGWPSSFAVKRIQYGIRWVEDALARGNYTSPIYPERVFGYKSWNADGYGDEVRPQKNRSEMLCGFCGHRQDRHTNDTEECWDCECEQFETPEPADYFPSIREGAHLPPDKDFDEIADEYDKE